MEEQAITQEFTKLDPATEAGIFHSIQNQSRRPVLVAVSDPDNAPAADAVKWILGAGDDRQFKHDDGEAIYIRGDGPGVVVWTPGQ